MGTKNNGKKSGNVFYFLIKQCNLTLNVPKELECDVPRVLLCRVCYRTHIIFNVFNLVRCNANFSFVNESSSLRHDLYGAR